VLLLLAVERLLVNLLLEEGKLLGRPVGGHRVLAMGAGAGGSRGAVAGVEGSSALPEERGEGVCACTRWRSQCSGSEDGAVVRADRRASREASTESEVSEGVERGDSEAGASSCWSS
jgi:hypothetical protein